jgi:hypothetical protein
MPSKLFEYTSIKYAIIIQNILFVLLGISFLCAFALMTLFDPYVNTQIVWILWGLIWIFCFCCISYFQFWWMFSFKGELIYINKVNNMLFKSSVYSSLVIYGLSLAQTNQLNFLNIVVLVCLFGFYFMYSKEL